jgi:hypothetical protein
MKFDAGFLICLPIIGRSKIKKIIRIIMNQVLVKFAKNLILTLIKGGNMKTFYWQGNVGRARYLLSFHNGTDRHTDGSPFFGVKIFKNKKKLYACIADLLKEGYTVQM